MTEKELNKIIVSGLDCIKAEDSVKARIKKELTGDTMNNNDIIMNTGKGSKAEISNSSNIKVNRHGRIIAAAAAVAILAGGGYMLSRNFTNIPEDESIKVAATTSDTTPTEAEDSQAESKVLTDEEHSELMRKVTELTDDMYGSDSREYALYTLGETKILVKCTPNEGDLCDYYVYDISDPDNITYKGIKEEPGDFVQIFDDSFAIISIIPAEDAGYEYMTVMLYDFDLELINCWKCQAEDGASFIKINGEPQKQGDYIIKLDEDPNFIHTFQNAGPGDPIYRTYDINGNMYGENKELLIDVPENIKDPLSYAMPRSGNTLVLGVDDNGNTTVSRKFATSEDWRTLTIPSDFEALQGIFDTTEKTYLFTGTADATGLLYTLDWDNGTFDKRDIEMPSTYVSGIANPASGRYGVMVFDMGENKSIVRVYDLHNDFEQVYSGEIDHSYDNIIDPDVELDESTGLLTIGALSADSSDVAKVDIDLSGCIELSGTYNTDKDSEEKERGIVEGTTVTAIVPDEPEPAEDVTEVTTAIFDDEPLYIE